ncbi:response regulator transcription factor [Clostridium brassicae]|uniref:Stage 0 sporulation protein A homolog n=1 Tax=Clostridium brassicae TaxID=2999072 RepID=A0ABT4DBD7_9CLOT|nr:response regulator transcription factor [Clostridium brassicae]MCY6958551.1 response regulator transcription factor [Clostridium brassicae]
MEYKKILIIEDEKPIAELLAYRLKKELFEIRIASKGAEGIKLVEKFKPNIILLDLMLPDISGLEVCKQITITNNNIPIVMITAKSDITDKIVGLEFGADDYITKPFDLREVVARVKSILRRIDQMNKPLEEKDKNVICLGDIKILKNEHIVKNKNESIKLTPKEYDLLVVLYESKGKVLTRSQILDTIWGYDYVGGTRTVDIHVQRLRKKLGNNDLIITVFGVGYKINLGS